MSASDIIASGALFFAVASFFFSYIQIILSKRIEIIHLKFEKLCLNVVEDKFNEIDEFIENKKNDSIMFHLDEFTNLYVDLMLLLIEIKSLYPKIDISQIQDLCDEFTDQLYDNSGEEVKAYKLQFLKNKIEVLGRIYDYALHKEFNYLIRKLFKI